MGAFGKPKTLHFQRNSDISQPKIHHNCVEYDRFYFPNAP